MDCCTAICFLFISRQFALTTSTSAPQLTVVGSLSPVYSCPGEQVTLSCTWNPEEVVLGGWDVNGTQHTLQDLVALEGHTVTTAKGRVSLTITSSHTSTTTYSCCAGSLHGGVSHGAGFLRSDPTTVNYDDAIVLNTTITQNRATPDSFNVTVRVHVLHRGCTDPIGNVMVAINSSVGQNCNHTVYSNKQDLGPPCEFKGLSSTELYKVTIKTQRIGGSYDMYLEEIIFLSDTSKPSESGDDLNNTGNQTATNTTWLIVGAVIGAVLLLSVLVVVAPSGGVLFIRCAKHNPKKSPDSDKPSSDQMYSVPDVTLEPSPAYATCTVEGTTSQGKNLYMNL